MTKDIKIRQVLLEGELDSPQNIPDMLEQAGRLLDKSSSYDICGEVLFRDDKGDFHVGTVEFVIGKAAPGYLVDTLADGTWAECDNCGHIEHEDSLDEMADLDERLDENTKHMPSGQCTQCGALSYPISLKRARQLAKVKEPK
jgi:hypothetical protein